MNLAQTFMLLQFLTSVGGAIGFTYIGKSWEGAVWLFYALSNLCWFMVARGS